ncbi:Bromodomain and PHD finger-containing protein 3 [Senna tora]|uniref:Bromodomain and PHD finger-containing protein 3 n=1 Tax=Senna tora TaxID=362788 RepID=A0A834XH57_9FABA|nr:Bromodomain and PHD finger-containing protein 3 [Senna tora]
MKEGQRRSPRISAMEAWQTRGSGSGSKRSGDPAVRSGSKGTNAGACIHKTRNRNHLDNGQGPAFQTRGRKKRKLRPVEELTASSSVISKLKQGQKQSDDEDIQKESDQPSKLPAATVMPEKRILELVLNILQRRDTYEIFAEPVDPKEVEDYYEIIEEPMDFGTMRAKLHEGMYKSLDQFEHDVFLIFNNAMHFNSSGTIYFRQARTINELAKKVFNVLKSDPENFESEFSETRQRVSRRNQGDNKDSANVKFSESTIGMSSKSMPCSSHATPNRKASRSNQGRDNSKLVDAGDLEDPKGKREYVYILLSPLALILKAAFPFDHYVVAYKILPFGIIFVYSRKISNLALSTRNSGRKKYFEGDKRSTYRPSNSMSLGEDESIFPTVYGKLKLLKHVNPPDLSYRESLMLFAKDLGQAAQNVVRKKLFGCEIHTASSSTPWRPITTNPDPSLTSQNPLNQFPGHPPNELRWPRDTINLKISGVNVNDDIDRAKVEEGTLVSGRGNAHSPIKGNILASQRISIGYDQVYKSKSSKEEQQPESSAIEHPQTMSRSMLENKCVVFGSQTTRDSKRGDSENTACSYEAGRMLQLEQTVPLTSSFIFNLPYLKTRLDQINSSEHYRLSQIDSGGGGGSGSKWPCTVQVSSYKGGLSCNHTTDLNSASYNGHNLQPPLLNHQRTDSSPSL